MTLFGIDSRWAYLVLLALMIGERLVELAISNRNLRRALAKGGVEAGASHYPWMVVQHTLFLVACPLEVFLLNRPFVPVLGITMIAILGISMGLRYWAVTTLGDRWTTRVVVLPGAEPVTGGPYRWVRHPNYLAVILEIAALPLVHSAWITALVFSILNARLLQVRIAVEEEALSQHNHYRDAFGNKPRLVPR